MDKDKKRRAKENLSPQSRNVNFDITNEPYLQSNTRDPDEIPKIQKIKAKIIRKSRNNQITMENDNAAQLSHGDSW